MTYREIVNGLPIKFLSKDEIGFLNKKLTHKNKNIKIRSTMDYDHRASNSHSMKEAEEDVQDVWMYKHGKTDTVQM